MPFLREKTGRWSPEKIAAFVVATVPMLWLLTRAWMGDLGAGLPERTPGPGVGLGGRPINDAILYTGRWTVRFILLALAITPARRLFNWPKLLNARRTIGVAAACYAFVHFCLYITDQKFRLDMVASEIVLRIYLTIGFTALLCLIALASTSTDAAVRRLGARWNTLHRLVYLIGVLAIVHFAMQKKLDIYEPTLMMGFLFWLLGWRIMHRWRRDTGFVSLLVLAVVAALLTAVFEAGWYGTLTGISARRVLEVNLMFDISIRPMWWALATGIAVALMSAAAQWLWPRESARTKLRAAE
ncbi:MAG: sulfoxide reductase heme-binding subunit YedZ [Bradyrhizobiaceae bacterium]|nr:sulfoxide reductase heme-binding subunit YedZ [Bradyrhizobiaceae bacterium]